MIEKDKLKKGMVVVYIPSHITDKFDSDEIEWGEVSSWNDSFVFVVYDGSGSQATRYEDLYYKEAFKAAKLLNRK